MAHYEMRSTGIEQLPFDMTTMNHGIPARSLLGDSHTRHADWRKPSVVIPKPRASSLHVRGREEQDRAITETLPPTGLRALGI